jgi:hypothetical protein
VGNGSLVVLQSYVAYSTLKIGWPKIVNEITKPVVCLCACFYEKHCTEGRIMRIFIRLPESVIGLFSPLFTSHWMEKKSPIKKHEIRGLHTKFQDHSQVPGQVVQ